MPYLYCQSCRLTLHEPRMFAIAATTCPRCKGDLDVRPARLFERGSPPTRRFKPGAPETRPKGVADISPYNP